MYVVYSLHNRNIIPRIILNKQEKCKQNIFWLGALRGEVQSLEGKIPLRDILIKRMAPFLLRDRFMFSHYSVLFLAKCGRFSWKLLSTLFLIVS